MNFFDLYVFLFPELKQSCNEKRERHDEMFSFFFTITVSCIYQVHWNLPWPQQEFDVFQLFTCVVVSKFVASFCVKSFWNTATRSGSVRFSRVKSIRINKRTNIWHKLNIDRQSHNSCYIANMKRFQLNWDSLLSPVE